MQKFIASGAGVFIGLVAASARAQPNAPTGAPPPDAKAIVEAPKAPGEAPAVDKPVDGTNATMSAGGQQATGNSRSLAATVNGLFETRSNGNGFGAWLRGN